MKILAIDTSSKQFVVALYDSGKLCGLRMEAQRRLSGLITVTIQRVLETAGCEPSDIDYFGCGVGPGSFTGMRIGLSAMKALAWALDKPLVPAVSLDILAQAVPESGSSIIPVIDAKRALLYCSQYSKKKQLVRRRRRYRLLTPQQVGRFAPAGSIFLGDGVGALGEEIVQSCRLPILLEADYWYPTAEALMRCVLDEIEQGNTPGADEVEPLYLYPKECQIRKK